MNIRVDLSTEIADGSEVVFRSPADCSQVTGLVIYHKHGKTEFAFADAHGNNVGDIDHLFAENAVVKVILDVASSMAFVQNADTNAYIERTFVKSVNGQAPDENGNVEVDFPDFIPAGGDPNMEARFDVAHAQMVTAPEFVIADPENPFNGIILTKEGAEEDKEPRKAVMLSDPAGNPVILSNVANPEAETDATNKKFVEEQVDDLSHYLEDLVYKETIQVYGAEVGQILKVKAVDDQGHPTAWETVDVVTQQYPVVGMIEAEAEIQPNTLYRWGRVDALTITLAPENGGVVSEYLFEFACGTIVAELTLPESVKWAVEPEIEAGKTYQVSILNGIAVIIGA